MGVRCNQCGSNPIIGTRLNALYVEIIIYIIIVRKFQDISMETH